MLPLTWAPSFRPQHRDKVASYLDVAAKEGASVALDGRKRDFPTDGFLLGPSVVDQVKPGMRLAKEEIFGPVLSVMRAKNLDDALAMGRDCEYGNGACIFTSSGHAAREFKRHFNAGMIGINVGVPAPDGLVPLHRLEQIVLRRFAHSGNRKHRLLHAAKDDANAMVRLRPRRHRRPVWKTKRG